MRDEVERVRTSAARAALDPALWPETLWRLGRLLGSDMTMFEHWKPSGVVELGFNDRPEVTAQGRAPYEEHYALTNPRHPLQCSLAPTAIGHDGLIGDEVALDCEFYVDFLSRFDLRYYASTTVASAADQTVILSMQRAPDRGRFTAADLGLFALLLPDLRNALALHLRMGGASPGPLVAAACDRLADPIAILGADGELVFANRSMQDLFATADIVRLEGTKLGGATESVRRALLRALGQAEVAGGSGLGAACAGPIIFRVAELDMEAAGAFRGPGSRLHCLLIDDPSRPHWSAVQDAMDTHGLTRREATVGTHLAAGLRVGEIARRLGVSPNTVRSQVAMLREKLGVRSALAVAARMRRTASPFI